METGRNKTNNSLPKIAMPGNDKLISKFAKELSEIIYDKSKIFYRTDSKNIIEIRKIKSNCNEEDKFVGFSEVQPNRFITLIEKFMNPGLYKFDKDTGFVFYHKSISAQLAKTLLCSEVLQEKLHKIERIFTIPIPILHNGKLTFPNKGYDKRFNSWLPHDSPEISDVMNIDEAKEILNNILSEFCFQTNQDKTNAIAGLLTPFLRGLFSNFNIRTPVYFYIANRERAGKDYLAGITSIIYEGHVIEDPPISTSENKRSNNTEELRKKLLAAFISGRKRIHFSNNKGYINNATFESIVTSSKYSDRLLGKNELLDFDNEIDFSLSGNTGIGFTPDFANRCRFVRLFLDLEDANARKFKNPDLHSFVKTNRKNIISALYTLVNNWIDNGKKEGTVLFASFPEWARICGGIMESAGYTSPCIVDPEVLSLGGDSATRDMKLLFEICYNARKGELLTKADIANIVTIDSESNMFSHIDFEKRSGQTRFGTLISKFIGRVLSDIRLEVEDIKVRSSRQKFRFVKIKVEKLEDINEKRVTKLK